MRTTTRPFSLTVILPNDTRIVCVLPRPEIIAAIEQTIDAPNYGTAIHACPARNAVPTDGTIDGNMRFLERLDKVEHVLLSTSSAITAVTRCS